MIPAVALLDANVLYPAPLRDLLLQLAFGGHYRARWSAHIAEEWKRNLLEARPHLGDRIERTQAVMHRAIPDALVTDYSAYIPELTLPDSDDRHVLAAAIKTAAEVIVTYNLKDFPATTLAHYGVTAMHPDAFLKALITAIPSRVLEAARECVARLRRPPLRSADYLKILRRLNLTETADFLALNCPHWYP